MKWLFLYNITEKGKFAQETIESVRKKVPEARVLDYQVRKTIVNTAKIINEGMSIWVPENKYKMVLKGKSREKEYYDDFEFRRTKPGFYFEEE